MSGVRNSLNSNILKTYNNLKLIIIHTRSKKQFNIYTLIVRKHIHIVRRGVALFVFLLHAIQRNAHNSCKRDRHFE